MESVVAGCEVIRPAGYGGREHGIVWDDIRQFGHDDERGNIPDTDYLLLNLM
jgi:hypothetical protein